MAHKIRMSSRMMDATESISISKNKEKTWDRFTSYVCWLGPGVNQQGAHIQGDHYSYMYCCTGVLC